MNSDFLAVLVELEKQLIDGYIGEFCYSVSRYHIEMTIRQEIAKIVTTKKCQEHFRNLGMRRPCLIDGFYFRKAEAWEHAASDLTDVYILTIEHDGGHISTFKLLLTVSFRPYSLKDKLWRDVHLLGIRTVKNGV